MEINVKKTILFIVIMTLSVITNAIADSLCDNSDGYIPVPKTIWSRLAKKSKKECYKSDVDNSKQAFGIDVTPKDLEERKTKTSFSWKMISDNADFKKSESNAAMSDLFSSISKRAAIAADTINESAASEIAKGPTGKSSWDIQWMLGILPITSNGTIHLKDNIRKACEQEVAELPSTATMQCQKVYKASEKLITIILIGHSVGTYYGQNIVDELSADIYAVNKEWDTFLYDSKPMYPLDLVTTDFFYRVFSDYDKSNEGFKRPPNWQWFFLHPAPAFDYVSDAIDGEQLKASVYLEVLGINAWKNKYVTGVSLIATYSDRNDVPDGGYGLLFTYKNSYSVAVTKYGSKTGVLFSLDVARFFKESIKPIIDNVRK